MENCFATRTPPTNVSRGMLAPQIYRLKLSRLYSIIGRALGTHYVCSLTGAGCRLGTLPHIRLLLSFHVLEYGRLHIPIVVDERKQGRRFI